MNKLFIIFCLLIVGLISCKNEHPDLKTAFDLFRDAQTVKQNLITSSADIMNQAKIVDARIRNENKEDVFTISEVYNHLEAVDKAMKSLDGRERAVPGHEKESAGIRILDTKLDPSQVLMYQKSYRDTLLIIKNDLDAAATLLNQLKARVK